MSADRAPSDSARKTYHVERVEELGHVQREPLVEVLSLGQHDCEPQVALTQPVPLPSSVVGPATARRVPPLTLLLHTCPGAHISTGTTRERLERGDLLLEFVLLRALLRDVLRAHIQISYQFTISICSTRELPSWV